MTFIDYNAILYNYFGTDWTVTGGEVPAGRGRDGRLIMRPTMLRVTTDAIAHNARLFRARIPGNVRMMCVVKANAYGHDAVRTARALLGAGADAFAVAMVEEAAKLRKAGIDCPVLILGGGCEDSLREAVRVGASQAVYDPWMLDVLGDEARRLGVRAKAHLKVDTGMSRIGVRDTEALKRLLERWKACPDVEMEGAFTHLCAVEEDAAFTHLQKRRFDEALGLIRGAGFSPIVHAAATSAMFDPEYQYDMVRPGIGLYGTCVKGMEGQLRYAQTLVTRPVRVERVPAGETVGYGRTFTAKRDSVIMTLPIGYGDGYPRILSNQASVLVRGRRAPLAGRVCMDMVMADVTDIPGVTLEDEVVLMGAQGNEAITPDELAEYAGTIPYEIMLGFSARVPLSFD